VTVSNAGTFRAGPVDAPVICGFNTMVSKKYIGKVCIYCGTAESAAGDHVVAREFFPPDSRHGIPKVPTCISCNTRKSEFEQYLMTLFPFASSHPVAQRMLSGRVSSLLAKNQRLQREIRAGIQTVWVPSESLLVPTMSLPFDPDKAIAYFAMVAQGLLFHHWGHILDREYTSTSMALTDYGVSEFQRRFWPPRAPRVVARSLANGALKYQGRGSSEAPGRSVWLIQIYGGLGMQGTGSDAGDSARMFGAMTARSKMFDQAKLLAKFAV